VLPTAPCCASKAAELHAQPWLEPACSCSCSLALPQLTPSAPHTSSPAAMSAGPKCSSSSLVGGRCTAVQTIHSPDHFPSLSPPFLSLPSAIPSLTLLTAHLPAFPVYQLSSLSCFLELRGEVLDSLRPAIAAQHCLLACLFVSCQRGLAVLPPFPESLVSFPHDHQLLNTHTRLSQLIYSRCERLQSRGTAPHPRLLPPSRA
jgi:hypothetical protein